MWRRFNAMGLATPEAFAENPARVWQFYHYRREKALQASPNAAHHALAQLSLPSVRNQVAPNSSFTLITQNVDGLSTRALTSALESASAEDRNSSTVEHPHILEMHGRLFDVKCWSEDCGHIEWNAQSPVCEALGGTEALIDAGVVEPVVEEKRLPHCSKCGELARPGVVWFGETPTHMDLIDKLVAKADVCLVVGTSSTVFPAAGYAAEVQDNGGKVTVFNLERSSGDRDADFLFLGPCEETLPEVLCRNLPSLRTAERDCMMIEGWNIG